MEATEAVPTPQQVFALGMARINKECQEMSEAWERERKEDEEKAKLPNVILEADVIAAIRDVFRTEALQGKSPYYVTLNQAAVLHHARHPSGQGAAARPGAGGAALPKNIGDVAERNPLPGWRIDSISLESIVYDEAPEKQTCILV
jgi:hypothetical protein